MGYILLYMWLFDIFSDVFAEIDDDMKYESLWKFEDFNSGIFQHTQCWKFVKLTYNIELTFSHLPVKKPYDRYSYIPIDYGDIKKYWHQDFLYGEMFDDHNEWMLLNPLMSIRNATRIKKIISQLKLKKLRPSPLVSATFYKNNDIKLGHNKKLWIIKQNKWVLLGETTTTKIPIYKNNKNKLIKISQINEVNNKPVFLLNLDDEATILHLKNYAFKL